MRAAPHRIDEPPIVLQRYSVDDAEELCRVIDESRAHVGRWMPWANTDPADVPWRREWLARVVESFERGRSWNYAIVLDGGVAGGCGIHPRADAVATIGYWLHPAATGRGAATAAARGLTRVASDVLGFETVLIRCDEANVRSASVAARLGYVHVATEPHTIDAPGQSGRSMVWRSPGGQEKVSQVSGEPDR